MWNTPSYGQTAGKHWNENGEHQIEGAWIYEDQWTSADGIRCCTVPGQSSNPDCESVPEDNVETTPEGLKFKDTGETVPWKNVRASKDGKIWRCLSWEKKSRCTFFPVNG